MVDRYATNQFYKINSFEPFSNYGVNVPGPTDNPPYMYPPKTLRNAANGVSTNIQRGYIRMMSELFDKKSVELSRRRFHFQFNPDSITRSVAARNDIQLWMNMDPAQMTQPIPGDANFAFELLLNREPEVTSGKQAVVGGQYAASNALISANTPAILPTEGDTNVGQYNVADIGVLADLIVFDELIGQGLNSSLLKSMVDRAETGYEYRAAQEAAQNKDSTKDEDDKTPTTTTKTFSRQEVETALKSNWGNSAFLISQPIRVVFSSLFIVEGYVSSTNVTFNKFSPTMVPTQAVIAIQMQAMYMGFGKKETFFTKTFTANEEKYEQAAQNRKTETSALKTLGQNLYKKVTGSNQAGAENNEYQISPSGIIDSSGDPDRAYIRFLASDALRDAISERKSVSKVTVSATLKIKYNGNSSSIPSGVTDQIGDEIYNETSTVDLDVNELDNKKKDPYSQGNFTFPKIPGTENVIHDKSGSSKYILDLVITTTIEGSGGGSVECDQVVKLNKAISWGDTVILGNEATTHVDIELPKRPTSGPL